MSAILIPTISHAILLFLRTVECLGTFTIMLGNGLSNSYWIQWAEKDGTAILTRFVQKEKKILALVACKRNCEVVLRFIKAAGLHTWMFSFGTSLPFLECACFLADLFTCIFGGR